MAAFDARADCPTGRASLLAGRLQGQRQAFAANGTLSHGEWVRVAAECERESIEFLSTPFDDTAVAQLVDLGVRRFKLASGDLTNRPLLERVAVTGLPVILSTGAANFDEVRRALAWWEDAGRKRSDVTLLACSLIYPCPPEHAHLDRIRRMRRAFNVPIGYSDHTREVETAVAAVALGATVLEKHFALGPSHVPDTTFAVNAAGLARYVKLAQLGEAMTADCRSDCEQAARVGARRSLCAARDLPAGTLLASADLVPLRPGGGIEPDNLRFLVGTLLSRAYAEGEPLDHEELPEGLPVSGTR